MDAPNGLLSLGHFSFQLFNCLFCKHARPEAMARQDNVIRLASAKQRHLHYLRPHEIRIGIIKATIGVLLRKAEVIITGIIMRTCRDSIHTGTSAAHPERIQHCAGSLYNNKITSIWHVTK
eukprot:GHRR01037737.1.p1 GENE.GHRR01037737.1~~GHRR01037737.1.p1  ORF type:complete len:121 (-),score=13.57 GHRR01037737.1:198-560(-)